MHRAAELVELDAMLDRMLSLSGTGNWDALATELNLYNKLAEHIRSGPASPQEVAILQRLLEKHQLLVSEVGIRQDQIAPMLNRLADTYKT